MKKYLLVIAITVLLIIPSLALGAAVTYYVDSAVTDTNVASATPDFTTYNPTTFATDTGSSSVYKTIADVNAKSPSAGDSVLFRKGQTWREQLTVPASGSAGSPITYGSYGTGDAPIISGANIISSWTQEEGDPIIAEEQASGTTDWNIRNDADSVYLCQGFESDSSIAVPKVVIPLKKVASPTGDVWVEIWATTGTPARYASLVATSDTLDVSTLTTSYVEKTFSFSPSVNLTADVIYLLAVTGDNTIDGTNYFRWALETGDNYRGGDPYRIQRYTAAHAYVSGADHDFHFHIYKDVAGGDVYSKAGITTEPNQVFYDGVRLTENDGATTGVGANEWDWAANTLYINVGEDPAGGTVEASQRDTAISCATDYVTIDGLHTTKANSTNFGNILITGTHVSVQNCDVSYGVHHGIALATTSESSLINSNTITYNGTVGADCGAVFVYKDAAGAGTENTISNNTINNNVRFGIYLRAKYNIVEHNSLSSNGNISDATVGIEIFNPDDDGYGSHNIVRYNVVTGQISGADNGEGIDCDDLADSNQVYYNIVYGNDGPGLTNWRATNNVFYNNVSYGNCLNSGGALTSKYEFHVGESSNDEVSGLVIKNNILVATQANTYAIGIVGTTYDSTGLTITNNDYYSSAANWYFWNATGGNVLATWNALTGVGTDLNSDPLFLDAAGGDFRLKYSSPARDAGTDVSLTEDYAGNTVPFGTAEDMGAYEFTPVVSFNGNDYVLMEDIEVTGDNVAVLIDGTNNVLRYSKISGGTVGILDEGGTNNVYATILDTQTDDAVVAKVAGSTFYHLTIYSPTDDGFDLQANAVVNNTIFEGVGGTDIYENGGTNAPDQTNYATSDGDPLFVNAGTGDFHLQNSSHARRGAASGTGVELDYDGKPYRTQVLRSLGPFQNEYRTGLTIN